MDKWRASFSDISAEMLSWEVEGKANCVCGNPGLFRCTECTGSPLRCKDCIRTSHKHLPLHWVEGWTDLFFQRYDLSTVGFVIYLGHNGDRCPNAPTVKEHHKIVIGHTNGIHDCIVEYCHCAGRADNVTQLLRARLWPATLGNPHSAFMLSQSLASIVAQLEDNDAQLPANTQPSYQ